MYLLSSDSTRGWIFFLLTWHLYSASHLYSAFQLCILSEVRLLNFLRILYYIYIKKTKHVCSVMKYSTSTRTEQVFQVIWIGNSGVPIQKPPTRPPWRLFIQSPTPALPLLRVSTPGLFCCSKGYPKLTGRDFPKKSAKCSQALTMMSRLFFAFSSSERYYIHIIKFYTYIVYICTYDTYIFQKNSLETNK